MRVAAVLMAAAVITTAAVITDLSRWCVCHKIQKSVDGRFVGGGLLPTGGYEPVLCP